MLFAFAFGKIIFVFGETSGFRFLIPKFFRFSGSLVSQKWSTGFGNETQRKAIVYLFSYALELFRLSVFMRI